MTRTIIIAAALCLSGCESSRTHGPCVGAFSDSDPAFRYETSTRNVILGVLFVETVIVPAWVIAKETKCPVARNASGGTR